ncbi:S8 family serine peptidase [Bacillus sp. WMMC1349]|uniref:S8 family peptidase n=1 Tax=Bacillus sp. WMMC1349 TaxID=2736254 RepID=UPI001556AEB0|nr:Ig-like domain-containing protein [Bacillus sp. WMMC1349]NPC93456.1 S8 family serine peptidase [Bacillus sp. WMMC1349]
MEKRKVCVFFVFMLMFTLVFGQFPAVKTMAAENQSSFKETTLTNSSSVNTVFKNQEKEHWYKIEPQQKEIANYTHFRIKLQSEKELTISIYSSLENAIKGHTFARYIGYSYPKIPAVIDFPIAWKGPYYIKIENNQEETLQHQDIPYTINYQGVTLSPLDQQKEELSTPEKTSYKHLSMIRDHLFEKTDKGKKWSSLYDKAAPFIGSKMLSKQSIQNTVSSDLVQLKSLFADIAKNGQASQYTITKEDQKAIYRLHKTVRDAVPEALKKQMDQIIKDIKIEDLAGSKVSTVLEKAGLTNSSLKIATKNRYIVKLKDHKRLRSFKAKVKSFGAGTVDSVSKNKMFQNMYVVEMDQHHTNGYHAAATGKISRLPEVEFIEPVQQYHALSADVQYPYQWSLKNSSKHVDIQFEKLQKLLVNKPLQNTVIAVVDTGVDHTLQDLSASVEQESGFNYISRNGDAMDDNGHGTHVSGIIAAAADNHYSMAGINPHAKILPVKVLDRSGEGDTEKIAYGIIYAVDHGAKVINLSLGGPYSRVIEYALKYAQSKNVTVIAASGNEGASELSYPASSKYTISVGATNQLALVSDYSNYGKGLDLVAPGSDIPSLVPDGNVTYMSGTSMAAPHVSAVAGLLISQNPSLKPNQVAKFLKETTADVTFNEEDNPYRDDIDFDGEPDVQVPGYHIISGWGKLNAFYAFSVFELNLKVNPVLNRHSAVTGTAKSGSTVKVVSGNKTLGVGKAGNSGTFKVNIPVQQTNQVLHVLASGGQAEASVRVIVEKAPQKPTVKRVTNKDIDVTGKTLPGYTVQVKDQSKKIIATGKADSSGIFKVKVKKQTEYTVLYVSASADTYRESGDVKVIVADAIPPSTPKIHSVTDKSKVITGKTEANALVIAKVKGKTIGTGKANGKGEFRLKVSKQKAGTTITVTAKDKAGNISKATKTTVKDKTPPTAPKVNSVTNKSTTVKGKAEANANIRIKVGKKTIGTGRVNKKGQYVVKIKKQKPKTILTVIAIDKAGNASKASQVKVKKAK